MPEKNLRLLTWVVLVLFGFLRNALGQCERSLGFASS